MIFNLKNYIFPQYDKKKTFFTNYQKLFELIWIICLIWNQNPILNLFTIVIGLLGIHSNVLEIFSISKAFILEVENAFKIHKNNPKLVLSVIAKAGVGAAGKGAGPAAKVCLFCISSIWVGSQATHHMTDGQIAPLRDGANIYFNHETKEQVYQRYHNYFNKPPMK